MNNKVKTDDGVEINYYLDDFTEPWIKEKDTIILQHALWENAKFLTPMVPILARKYRVIRPDMRGRGDSTAPPPDKTLSSGPDESTLAQRQAKDNICILDHLGIDNCHWFGVGGGGTTGICAAVLYPDRLKSLCFSSSPEKVGGELFNFASAGEDNVTVALEKYGVQGFHERGLWQRIIDHTHMTPEMEEWNLNERLKLPLDVMIRCTKWMRSFDYSDFLPQIKCPTLLIGAETDKLYTPERYRSTQSKIPNAKLVIIEGIGRGVHLFRPDRMAQELFNFINTVD